MKVWINKNLSGYENAWEMEGSRYLKLVNTTGKHGKVFENVFLGYKRFNRTHFIFINDHRIKNTEIRKECGIWISDQDYNVIGNETFTGKTKSMENAGIIGRFGIYDMGTIIECYGKIWKLKEDKGWVITQKENLV